MKENFLHYLWKQGLYSPQNLKTTKGLPLQIIHPGQYTEKQGPDFFNAVVFIGQQKWAGNVEIHLKSSDWYAHHHESDQNYDSVILHVVWDHDMEVFNSEGSEIPVLEFKNFVEQNTLSKYHQLMSPKSWIYCENHLKDIDTLSIRNWQDRLFIERLSQKAELFHQWYQDTGNHWEEVLFWSLAGSFGLHSNKDSFIKTASIVGFDVFKREVHHSDYPEAILFGISGLLNENFQENYPKSLQMHWNFLKSKYLLKQNTEVPVTFYKVRPDNFPTIRLVQLSNVYQNNPGLFQKIIEAENITEIKLIFNIKLNHYWETHYLLDKPSKVKAKSLTESFIHLIIINTIIPLKFAFMQWMNKMDENKIYNLIEEIPPEKNKVIDYFNSFGIYSQNAIDSQALVQLKTKYCDFKKCLECDIGKKIMKPLVVR